MFKSKFLNCPIGIRNTCVRSLSSCFQELELIVGTVWLVHCTKAIGYASYVIQKQNAIGLIRTLVIEVVSFNAILTMQGVNCELILTVIVSQQIK